MTIGRIKYCDRHRVEHNERVRKDNEYFLEHGEYPKEKVGQRLLKAATDPVCDECKFIF